MHGTNTLAAEVTRITGEGLSLQLGDETLPVAFADFPWLQNATPEQLRQVQRPSADHLYWPQIDVDLSVDSLRHPHRYPLMSGLAGSRPALDD